MKQNPESASARQPLCAAKYAIIAAVGLAVAIGFTFFYVRVAPSLNFSGEQDRIFYLLLIPWALSCAAFLFGAMRGYARFAHKRLGNSLELGGPVVLFCLVLVGGFKLVPSGPDTFDVTVRASGPDTPSSPPAKLSSTLAAHCSTSASAPTAKPSSAASPPT